MILNWETGGRAMSNRQAGGTSGTSRPTSAPAPGGFVGRGPMGRGSPRIEKARDPRGALRRLVSYLGPHRWALTAIFVLAIVSSLLDLASPALLGIAIDRFISQGDLGGLVRISLLMLGAYLASSLASVAQGQLMATVSQKAMRELRRSLFQHLQTLSLSFFDRQPHGELMSRFTNDMDAINRVISMQVTQLFSGLISLIGIVVMMFVLNYGLALASMIVLPLMLGLVGIVGKRTRAGFRAYQTSLGQLNAQLEETFTGERVIMAFAQQRAVLEKFDQANETVRTVGIRAQTYGMLVPPLMGIFSNANIAVVVGVGGWMTLQGWATVGTIASFMSYSRNFANPLRQLADLYNQIQSALAGAERIFEMIDRRPELTDAPDALALADVRGEVQFEDVQFSYVPSVPVIKGVMIQTELENPSGRISILPTGAGKTTFINLLSRFYDVEGGAIRIDRRDIRHLTMDSLRLQLGIVLQDTYLFSTTVMENIRYGRLDATDEECVAAARLANAHQFIRRLPSGYETELSERAANLSQGQRQLIAIARAVLADPGILILDEATSSVDTRTEIQIQEALLRLMKGRTSFVIAHRLSTIRNADSILVINDGAIIERGTHAALMAQQGFYYNLYMSQFRGKAA